MKKILVFFLISVSLITLAHVPVFHYMNDNSIFIEDVYLSQIHYYEFKEAYNKISFTFNLEENKNLYILLGVPKIDRLENFGFIMSIEDSKGDIIEKFESKNLESEIMYEFFGDTYSWEYLRYDKSLQEGDYSVEISTKEKGKVWIAFGKREEFTTEQIFSLPKLIKVIREFHELEGRATWEKYTLGITIGLVSFLFALKYF